MKTVRNIIGNRYGRLSVINMAPRQEKEKPKWKCLCDCGIIKIISGESLTQGKTQSCGCLRNERVKQACITHGKRHAPEYAIWCAMIQRCTNPNDNRFKDWGGRGIKICDHWFHSFENFFADMGHKPLGKSLDRINNDGNYCPENCRWATPHEQRINSRPKQSNIKKEKVA